MKRLSGIFASVLLLVGCAGRSADLPYSPVEPEPSLRLAVIGDRTGRHAPGVYPKIVSEIERLKPDLTLMVGDMIEGYSSDANLVRQQWQEFRNLIEPLSAPVYCTPGNHDIWDEDSFDLFKEMMGRANYSLDYGGAHFVVFENGRWDRSDQLPQETIDWLISDLKSNQKASHTLVFFHKPFWFDTLAHGRPDRLHTIFKKYGVDAVFTGHHHVYYSGEYDGIRYIGMGSSGGAAMTGLTGLKYHFAWVTLNKAGVHVALIKDQSVFSHDAVTAADLVAVEKIETQFVQVKTPVKVIGADPEVEQQPYVFTIRNPHSDLTVVDELRWDVPDGWRVEPVRLPVSLAPGQELNVATTISSKGPLFPAPRFKLNLPYKAGASYEFSRSVKIERQTICHRVQKAPQIDGRLDETTVWQNPETRFYPSHKENPPAEQMAVYFAHDRRNLYFSAVCRESKMDQIHALATRRDDAVYSDDCICLFLAPDGKNHKNSSYELCFNANGVFFDQRMELSGEKIIDMDSDWNADCDVKALQRNGHWQIEARIPFESLGVKNVRSGAPWRVNFHRKQKRLKTSSAWMVPMQYHPHGYGVMILE